MMKKQILLSALASLILSGCGIYSKYHPVTEVPDNLYGEEAAVSDTLSIGTLGWREIFTDPQLQDIIEQGLKQNTDLQSACLRVKEAEATLLSAKLAYLPSFALAPQGTASSFDHQKAVQTYTLPVTASWTVDIFGGIRNAKRQAKALLEQSRDYRQAVQVQLIAGIANTYYTLLMLDAQLAVSEQTEQSWKETVDATRALMDAGMANEAAVSQMEAACYSVGTSVLDLKEQINQVENSLSLLLAETPHAIRRGSLMAVSTDGRREDGWTRPYSLPGGMLSVGLPVRMLDARPDVRAAERSLEAAFYGTNAARSAFYPSIALSGSAGWTNSAGSVIVNPGRFMATAVASLTQPLFNRGTNIARLKIAKAQQEEACLAFQQTLLNAGSEVNEALVQVQTARDKSDLYDRQVQSLYQAYESTSLLMQYGNTTYLEVLTAQQTLLGARLGQIANRVAEVQGVISLYQALGGGID